MGVLTTAWPTSSPCASAIGADGNGGRTGERCLIKDLLIMFAAIGFFAGSQDVLGFGMSEGDVLLAMALLLPGIRFFLLLGVFGASDGSLCPIGEHP